MFFADLVATFFNNLLPIILISGLGFLLGKTLSIDARSLGRVLFYTFSPILVFNLLYKNKLPLGEIMRTMGVAASVILAIGALALIAGFMMRLPRPALMAVLLTSMFANNGNYGLPLISFAFGDDAAAHASLYFVASIILTNSLGVLVASLGHLRFRDAIIALFKVPTVYAAILGLVMNQLGVQMSFSLERSADLLAAGSIPLMLVLLGLELTRVQWSESINSISLSVALRLLIGPVVAIGLAGLFGLSPAARQADVTQSSMSTAVVTTVLATEYNLEPPLVTSIVFVSTILSPFTLTPLLVYLGR